MGDIITELSDWNASLAAAGFSGDLPLGCSINAGFACDQPQSARSEVALSTAAAIQACVPNSMNVTSDERQNMELNDVDECDLAAAHQAFYVATGKDLFDGKMVRTRDRGLFVWSGGLGIIDKSSLVSSHGINIDDPHGCIVVSCSLPRDLQKDFLYWLTRQWGAEIGLIIGRPGAPTLFIEIKSTERVTTEHMRRLRDLSAERDDVEPLCVSPKIGTHHFEHLAL